MRAWLRRPSVWIVVFIVIVGGVLLALRARGPSVTTVVCRKADLEHHVVASGRVWVPTRVEVSAQTSGLVIAVGVIEGQHVKAGDLLVQLDDSEARAAVAQAKASVDQANARVDQLRRVGSIVATEELRQAQTNLDHAEADLARTKQLFSTGAIARDELDNGQRAVDIARAQKTAAEAQQISSAPMGADSRVALTALFQAQAQLAGANVRLSQTKLSALQDSVVLTRTVEPGDVVQTAHTLLVLAAGGDSQLVFQADERNLSVIQLGQKARASADAYPQQVFDAVVSYVAPSIDPKRGSVEIRLRVPTPPAFLKPDMTVSIDLTVAAKKQVTSLPSDAVHDTAMPTPWVFVVEDGRVVRKEVTLGIRGDGAIEIASGVNEGAQVVVPDGQLLTTGQRVRASVEER
jgi:HlyD family secretion protein